MSEEINKEQLEIIYLKETMYRFLELLMSRKANRRTNNTYEEMLDIEIDLVRNALVWMYDYKYFNVSCKKEGFYKRDSFNLREIERFCSEKEVIELNLKK